MILKQNIVFHSLKINFVLTNSAVPKNYSVIQLMENTFLDVPPSL